MATIPVIVNGFMEECSWCWLKSASGELRVMVDQMLTLEVLAEFFRMHRLGVSVTEPKFLGTMQIEELSEIPLNKLQSLPVASSSNKASRWFGK